MLTVTLPFPAAILIANPWQKEGCYCFFLAVEMKNSKQILPPILCFQQPFIFPLLFS